MSGQLVIVLVPSANSVAAISFNTLFLAPPTATSPDNRFPPVTTNRSLTRVSVNSGTGSVSGYAAGLPGYGLTMAVHLTRIYTRTGDDGTTGLERFQPGVEERRAARGVRRLRRDQRRHRRRGRIGAAR